MVCLEWAFEQDNNRKNTSKQVTSSFHTNKTGFVEWPKNFHEIETMMPLKQNQELQRNCGS